MKPVVFAGVRRICLIGGGDLMAATAERAMQHHFEVRAIVAPRHVDEVLPASGGTLRERLLAVGVSPVTVRDINDLNSWSLSELAGEKAIALCFGPSWIFSDGVRNAFGFGMFNINQIPIPRYLGGAHYSWQILHGDRTGGFFVQEITENLDRGDLLVRHTFEIPESARIPRDFFNANFEEGRSCVDRFIALIKEGGALDTVSYKTVERDRMYLPRLTTLHHAYIDWSWSAREIERFCNAFDEPYAGAMTFLQSVKLHLRAVKYIDLGCRFHPFSAGLVVRHHGDEIVVAARDGALQVGKADGEDGVDLKSELREGRRLSTPMAALEAARAYRPRLSASGFVQ